MSTSPTPPPARDLAIEAVHDDATLTLALTGEMDIASAGHLERTLEEHVGARVPELVVIDLRGLEFLDSSGLRALFLVEGRVREAGATLVFVHGPAAVRRVFEITRLDERLEMVDDPADLPSNPQPR